MSNETNCGVVERGPWKVFAKIGHIFGLVSLIGVLVPFISATLAVDGIVFSILGKKSSVNRDKANKGLTMNIIACAVNFVVSVVVTVIYLLSLEGMM